MQGITRAPSRSASVDEPESVVNSRASNSGRMLQRQQPCGLVGNRIRARNAYDDCKT